MKLRRHSKTSATLKVSWLSGHNGLFTAMPCSAYEGLLIAGLAQPALITAAMFGAAMFLFVACISDDRRRHGMFVSGWQKGATVPLMLVLLAFLVSMACAAMYVRSSVEMEPLGLAIGMVTFVVCTALSIGWERIYRAELLRKDRP